METLTRNIDITYEGQQGYIDINTFLTSQFHFVGILNEIQKELFPEQGLSIKIKATKEGSFKIELLLITAVQVYLLNKENIDILLKTITVLGNIIRIRNFLKGKKADKTTNINDQVRVEINIDGNNNVINFDRDSFNIYKNNESVNTAIQKNFELLENDENISGITIKEKDGKEEETVYIPRRDFQNLTNDNEYLKSDKKYEQKTARLYIKKSDYFPKETHVIWNFIYDSLPIKATIRSQEFIKKINEGERFAQGDALDAELVVELEFDEKLNTNVRTGKYDIIEVHKIIRRDEQKLLFDEKE
jgi:hypothetical protein